MLYRGVQISMLKSIKTYSVLKAAIKADEIISICRKEKPDIIFIDYIGLMTPPRDLKNRNLELGEISHKLKQCAKEFNIPVIACSQLNRAIETRIRVIE